MLLAFLTIFVIYISFRIGIDIYESFYIKKEAAKDAVLMEKKEYLEAGLYAVYKKIIDIFDALASLFIVVIILSGGLWLINYLDNNNSLITIFAYFALVYIVSLPIMIYSKIIDKRFGFNKASWKLFVIDEIKKIILFVLIGGIIFWGLIYFIENFENWWIVGFVFVFIVILLVNILYPIFMSLFNKFTPLENEELKNDIENIMEKVGFKANGIFVMDASKRDSRLNAFFGGFGKTKRVVLFDTLVEKLTPNEIIAVLGHELGHFKHKDIIKNIGMMGIMMFGLFFIIGHLPDSLFQEAHIKKTAGNILVLAFIIGEVYFYALSPIINLISRHNEFAADEMGAELGSSKDLKSALIKLIKENKSFPKSSKIYSIMYHSHPSVLERIEELDKK
ncbi:MAG: M48 family peptidase [Nautilia sp.]|nr:MAG: M48 family peptidase [Nautilia sp.]